VHYGSKAYLLFRSNHISTGIYIYICFWATVCKTVCPMQSDRCLSVCDVGVLWPNGWMNQDKTWHGGRPRPQPQCFRCGPSSPSPKGALPQFLVHVCCGQTAGWIKMPLGTEVDLSPGDIVLDGDPSRPHKGGHSTPSFGPRIVAKRLHGSRCHLVVG